MKKNFFKKLSFVMALAMMISVIAPASGAFAAASPALNSKSKTLLLGNEDRSEYDFNVKNKVSGASYKWASSNKKVATVDKNGYATAVAIGTAKVSVKIVKKGKTVKTLTATVVVKDNIKELNIVAPTGADVAKLASATDYDFGRTFKTESGSTKKTTSVTRWVVTEGATISDAGVFKADKAGKYTITAVAFQSKAKYEAWKTAGKDLKSTTILAQKALEVTVVNSIKEVKQADTSSFKVTFNADMKDTDLSESTANVYQVIDGKNIATGATKISKIEFDSTGKVATVTLFAKFAQKSTYSFVYGDLTGSFTTAEGDLSKVTAVSFKNKTVNTNEKFSLLKNVQLLNSEGVVILNGDDVTSDGIAVQNYISFNYDGDNSKAYIVDKDIYNYTMGYAAPLTVTFKGSVYDKVANSYKDVDMTAKGTVTRVSLGASIAASAKFTLGASSLGALTATTWSKGLTTVAVQDALYYINARYYPTEDSTTYAYTNGIDKFYYKSSNDSVILVGDNGMQATANPVGAGKATILVYDNESKTVVATFDVTVVAARSLNKVMIVTNGLTLSNSSKINGGLGDNADVRLMPQDGTGTGFTGCTASAQWTTQSNVTSYPTLGTVKGPLPAAAVGEMAKGLTMIKVNALGATPAVYQLKITFTDNNDPKNVQYAYVQVRVVDGSTNQRVSYWRMETTDPSSMINTDIKGNFGKDAVVGVFGYNASGVRVDQLRSGDYVLTATNGSTTYASNDSTTTCKTPTIAATGLGTVPIVALSGSSASPKEVVPYAKGSWTLKANLTAAGAAYAGAAEGNASHYPTASNYLLASTAVNLNDTTEAKPVVENWKITSASGTASIFQIVQDAFGFTLNGSVVDETNIVAVEYAIASTPNGIATASDASVSITLPTTGNMSVIIKSVTVKVSKTDYTATGVVNKYFNYKITSINSSITVSIN